VRLCIADPPYPPHLAERYDLADGGPRILMRSRARRWYGDGTRPQGERPADFHDDAGEWDTRERHRALLEQLMDEYDSWAIATSKDRLDCYSPLPIGHELMFWHKPTAIRGSNRIMHTTELVIVYNHHTRRPRHAGGNGQVPDVLLTRDVIDMPDLLIEPAPQGFAGAKPERWTHWVLDAMSYDPDNDTVFDMFPGSGRVSAAIASYAEQGVLL
jgi:hypothetical protein